MGESELWRFWGFVNGGGDGFGGAGETVREEQITTILAGVDNLQHLSSLDFTLHYQLH